MFNNFKLRELRAVGSVGAWLVLIASYLIIAWALRESTFFANTGDYLRSIAHLPGARILFVAILALGLMLPLSSGTILVLIGVDIFGGGVTFILSIAAGLLAAVASYWCGRQMKQFFPWLVSSKKLDRALRRLMEREVTLWWFVMAVRAIPNPLYDVWGYAAGLLRIRFVVYITASLAGGMVPVSLLCFLLPRMT